MKLSILIVTCGRLELLKACCESVERALAPEMEAIILVNGGDGATRRWLAERGHPQIRSYVTPLEHRALARNRAFDLCQGEIIYFLDDDVTVPPHLFSAALRRFEENPRLAVLGGPNLTPLDSPWLEKVFGAVMRSSFAAPMIRLRYGSDTAMEKTADEHDLILCNLAFRRTLIPRGLRFKEDLKSNEENLFLYECRKRQLRAGYDSSLFVFHRRRATWKGFLAQIYSYGFGRAQQTWAAPRSAHGAFFVPALAWALLGWLIATGSFGWLAVLVGAHVGLSALAAVGSRAIRTLGVRALALAIPTTGVVHLAYGMGFWLGLGRCLVRQLPLLKMQPPVIEPRERLDVV